MTIDVLPTVANLIHASLPDHPIDGLDIWPLLTSEPDAKSPHESLFFYYRKNELQAMRSGNWKLHFPHGYRSMHGREIGTGGTPGKYDYGVKTGLELYDLGADIGESKDLAAEYPDVVYRLQVQADAMRAELGDTRVEAIGSGVREPGRVTVPR